MSCLKTLCAATLITMLAFALNEQSETELDGNENIVSAMNMDHTQDVLKDSP